MADLRSHDSTVNAGAAFCHQERENMFVPQIKNKPGNCEFLVLFLITAILLGACSPETGKPQADGFGVIKPAVGDRAAARVNETLITIMDIEREAVVQGLIQPEDPVIEGSAIYVQLLDELIDQRLLALEAVKRKLDQDPEALNRLAIAREKILGNILVERAIADAVTEDTISRLYKEQAKLAKPSEEVRARHILVNTKEEAAQIRILLVNGATFAALAFERSKDSTTRLEGGDLGFFSMASMVEPFSKAAFALKPDEISQPVQTKYGWHIIQLKERRKTKTPSLEVMRPRIVRFMTFDEIQRLVTGLRENATIEREDAPEPTQSIKKQDQ
ncbi:MAG: peptidylprolyl isomerase [Robiginitomaculum sp.]|nr:peptidylprolyl isomerase [Robiginitomaculum sp.]